MYLVSSRLVVLLILVCQFLSRAHVELSYLNSHRFLHGCPWRFFRLRHHATLTCLCKGAHEIPHVNSFLSCVSCVLGTGRARWNKKLRARGVGIMRWSWKKDAESNEDMNYAVVVIVLIVVATPLCALIVESKPILDHHSVFEPSIMENSLFVRSSKRRLVQRFMSDTWAFPPPHAPFSLRMSSIPRVAYP